MHFLRPDLLGEQVSLAGRGKAPGERDTESDLDWIGGLRRSERAAEPQGSREHHRRRGFERARQCHALDR